VACVAAAAAGLARGRSDGVRAHRALSATLWAILLPAAALLVVCASLIVAVDDAGDDRVYD
jgi:hypothetical protein